MTDYRVFGLKVRSDIPLPELFEGAGAEKPDVWIARGPVAPPEDDSPGLHVAHGALVLVIPEVGRYRIEEGRRITVDARAGVPEGNVRLFLLGSAFGALLHQRGLLPLHANAVEIDGKAVAFMGESGAGKSTLAAWFHDQGYRVLADDVCVVRFGEDGQAMACAGLPRLRLWRDALEASGRAAEDFEPSFSGDPTFDKFDVALSGERRNVGDLPLQGIYLLDSGDHFHVGPITGLKAAEAIFAHTYRGAFLTAAGGSERHWRQSLELVHRTAMFRMQRTWGVETLDAEARVVLKHVQAASRNAAAASCLSSSAHIP